MGKVIPRVMVTEMVVAVTMVMQMIVLVTVRGDGCGGDSGHGDDGSVLWW